MSSYFQPLKNISKKKPPEKGESVLWRGLKTGRKGNPSTKEEFFNGKVHGTKFEDNELYVYKARALSTDSQ